jgi:hypothetical protein
MRHLFTYRALFHRVTSLISISETNKLVSNLYVQDKHLSVKFPVRYRLELIFAQEKSRTFMARLSGLQRE